MNTNNERKFYSYFCFDKQSKFGSVKGKLFNLKSSTYKDKDGKDAKRINFALACNNIDKKAEYILGVEPTVSNKNPETIFIDCVAFGNNAERLEKFLQQNDEVFVTGALSSYEGKTGNRLNLRVQDAVLWKRYGEINTNNQIQEQAPSNYESANNVDIDDDDEIPF